MGNLGNRLLLEDTSSSKVPRPTRRPGHGGEAHEWSGARNRTHLVSQALVGAFLLVVSGCGGNAETRSLPSPLPGGSPAAPSSSASAPAIGRIAYVHKSEDETSGGVFLVNADGTKRHTLTGMVPNVLDGQPDWSRDGRTVIFTETKNDNTDHASVRLIAASTEGKTRTPLTAGRPALNKVVQGYDDRGRYSPDGHLIAYVHAEGRDKEQLGKR